MVPLFCAFSLNLTCLPSSWSCATSLRRRTQTRGYQSLTRVRRPRQSDTLALEQNWLFSSAFDTGAPTVHLLLLYAALHRATDVPLRPVCLIVYHTLRMSANTHLCLRKERGWGGG